MNNLAAAYRLHSPVTKRYIT